MDGAEALPLWAESNVKPSALNLFDYIPTFSLGRGPSASVIPSTSRAATFRSMIVPVVDALHNPWLVGGVVAVTAAAVGALSFLAYTKENSNAHIARIQAENQKLFSEIDRLSRDNELLLEGNHRAAQLNQEVQALVRAMQADNANPEALQGELQAQLKNLLELVHRQTSQLQARNEELLAQTRLLREENLCKICCEYPVARSFVPCGHGTCVKCSSKLTKMPCPFCRTDVDSIIPRY